MSRTRVNPVASIKIKNNLLAITLILTTLPPSVQVSKPLIEQIGSTLSQYFGVAVERPELGLTAIHCATTFLSASLRPTGPNGQTSPILAHTTLYILPGLISHLAEAVVTSASAESPQQGIAEGVKEVVKALVTWTGGLPEDLRPRGYSVLLPSLSLLLDQSGQQSSQLHLIATTTLLGLAQSNPKAFRDATMGMEEGERGRLEKAIRDAVGGSAGRGGGSRDAAEKKGIELKSFG